MNPRWAGLTAPFRWLIDAFDVGRHQPAIVIVAIAATTLAGFLPTLPTQLMALFGAAPGLGTQFLFQAVSAVFAVAIAPVLTAGVYRILEGAERGQPVAVAQVLDGFRDGSWGRLVACTVIGFGLFFALFATMAITVAVVAGSDVLMALQQWAEQLQALQARAVASGEPLKPEALPPPPDGLGGVFGVLLAFSPLAMVLAVGVGWAQVSVALRGTSPLQAMLGALRAAFLNALPLLAMALVLLVPAFLLALLLGLVAAALIAVASLLGAALGGLVAMLMVMALSVVLAAISYGFLLNGWRATCDDDAGAPLEAAPLGGFEA